jgi:hypothetical protein
VKNTLNRELQRGRGRESFSGKVVSIGLIAARKRLPTPWCGERWSSRFIVLLVPVFSILNCLGKGEGGAENTINRELQRGTVQETALPMNPQPSSSARERVAILVVTARPLDADDRYHRIQDHLPAQSLPWPSAYEIRFTAHGSSRT